MLKKRLALLCELIEGGGPLCDVGTDHGLLPIFLVKEGRVPLAYACDIAEGPLSCAKRHILAQNVEDRVIPVLSDGLDKIPPGSVKEVVIAGMGGEMIAGIVSRAEWLKDGVGLILQPNSRAGFLVGWLCMSGYRVVRQLAVLDGGIYYTALRAEYDGNMWSPTLEETILGGLEKTDPAAREYVKREAERLRSAAKGMSRSRDQISKQKVKDIIKAVTVLEQFIGED